MGVALTELLLIKEIDLESLRGKVLVVDAPMWLYQFLSSIRQRDGTLLMDSKGNVTSHLMGLLTRISNLSQQNIKLAFVFDGEPPKLKHLTLEKRKELKIEAEKKFKKAKEKEDLELMKKYASRTSRLTEEMIEEALWVVKGKTIGILGLAFKPNTDDMRFAPSIDIITELQKEGAEIKVYDPQAVKKAKNILKDIVYCNNPYDVAKDADALIVITEWKGFKELDLGKIKAFMKYPLIIDGRNIYDPEKLKKEGFMYISIGRKDVV